MILILIRKIEIRAGDWYRGGRETYRPPAPDPAARGAPGRRR